MGKSKFNSINFAVKLALIFLGVVALMLQYKLWLRPDGLGSILQNTAEIKRQQAELDLLQVRNQQLLEYIKYLKQDPTTIEEHARVLFGMVKPHETYYRVIE